MAARTLTPALCRILALHWPVERPNEHRPTADAKWLIDQGFMYQEDLGGGWNRMGLTDLGRAALEWHECSICRRVHGRDIVHACE